MLSSIRSVAPHYEPVRSSHNDSVIFIQDNPSKKSMTAFFTSAKHPFYYYQRSHPPVVYSYAMQPLPHRMIRAYKIFYLLL